MKVAAINLIFIAAASSLKTAPSHEVVNDATHSLHRRMITSKSTAIKTINENLINNIEIAKAFIDFNNKGTEAICSLVALQTGNKCRDFDSLKLNNYLVYFPEDQQRLALSEPRKFIAQPIFTQPLTNEALNKLSAQKLKEITNVNFKPLVTFTPKVNPAPLFSNYNDLVKKLVGTIAKANAVTADTNAGEEQVTINENFSLEPSSLDSFVAELLLPKPVVSAKMMSSSGSSSSKSGKKGGSTPPNGPPSAASSLAIEANFAYCAVLFAGAAAYFY